MEAPVAMMAVPPMPAVSVPAMPAVAVAANVTAVPLAARGARRDWPGAADLASVRLGDDEAGPGKRQRNGGSG